MNIRKTTFILITIILFFSCKKNNLEQELYKIIFSYMKENIPKTDVIDSMKVISIDTLTPSSFLQLYNQSLNNQIELLNQQFLEAQELENDSLADLIGKKNILTFNKIDSVERLLNSPTLDKSSIWGYFVITQIFITHPDREKEVLDIGFPITKEMKIKELDLQ